MSYITIFNHISNKYPKTNENIKIFEELKELLYPYLNILTNTLYYEHNPSKRFIILLQIYSCIKSNIEFRIKNNLNWFNKLLIKKLKQSEQN